MEESLGDVGVYTAETPELAPGLYPFSLLARDEEVRRIAELEDVLLVRADNREMENARYNPERLREIAQKSGSEFMELDQLKTLPDKIPWTDVESQRLARFHLWHFPPLYVLIVLLLAAE